MELPIKVKTQFEIGQHIWISYTPYRDDEYIGVEEFIIKRIFLSLPCDEDTPVTSVDERAYNITLNVMYELESVSGNGCDDIYNLSEIDGSWGRLVHDNYEDALKAIEEG